MPCTRINADLNGNTLVINANGVTSSTGKNVTFTRDGQNRITQIQDPAGNSLLYSYDSSGNLSTFTALKKDGRISVFSAQETACSLVRTRTATRTASRAGW